MKKFFATALLVFLFVVGGGFAYLSLRKPNAAPPSSIVIERTPERLARGKYLFEVVNDCDGCHSERDFTRFGNPVVTRGKGFQFPAEMGLPGTVAAPNISSDVETGIGGYTDGEILRALREGIAKDGHAMFPLMPYPYYAKMSDEDAYSLVAFIRTIPPVKAKQPPVALKFPVNLMMTGVPKPLAAPVPQPDRSNKLKYGEYLTTVAACVECHTPEVRGQLVEEKRFGGGREFRLMGTRVLSANITSDTQTGLGKLSEDQWVEKFYQYKEYVEKGSKKVGPEGVTLMPWLAYAQMEEADLRAIYTYMRTVKPVVNSVETHPENPTKK
ncbi:MAG: cytochrome C [Candidatus Solibacter usitatus]|nr:cytochrome C [Candidatus Solibacter usitatus]